MAGGQNTKEANKGRKRKTKGKKKADETQKQKEQASKIKTSKKTVATKTKKSINDDDKICSVCCKNDPSHKWICCIPGTTLVKCIKQWQSK